MKADSALRFFKLEVNNPARIKITPCPIANMNNIRIANDKFLPMAANAMMPASIGVEQGVPASAKVIPRRMGYKNKELPVLDGIDLIIVGVSKSNISSSFKPITSKSEAIKTVK